MNEKRLSKFNEHSILKLILIAAMSLALIYSVAAEDQNTGAEEITLFGGSTGPVPFPHGNHQERLEDCKICHYLFPQNAGAIVEFKARETLKKQQVMKELCIKCHRQGKLDGIKSGPTSCYKCHIRSK